ncbi:hypothetical protein [Streptomyces scabiei]|uniref:hypothetical protein n=1 Tax=Streptomyces scabiei TaxID=1930 RepID=UPI00076580CB|nr:hypothetical protein [Streptomyces scabiei]
MQEDNCALLGWCNSPFHDHEEETPLPELAKLLDTDDPAFGDIARVLVDMSTAGVEPTAESVQIAIKLGRLYHSAGQPTAVPQDAAEGLWHEVVYYMRFGNLIKIGTTGQLYTRVRRLKPDKLLAAEPGSYDLEAKRHREFARFRAEGEHFYPAPPLLQHIRRVQAQYKPRVPKRSAKAGSTPVVAKLGEQLF